MGFRILFLSLQVYSSRRRGAGRRLAETVVTSDGLWLVRRS